MQLKGRINGVQISGTSDLRLGASNTIDLIAKYSDSPFGYAGDVSWTVTVQHTGQVVNLSPSTRIEIHNINSLAQYNDFFNNTAVPVGLLRLAVLPATSNYLSFITSLLMNTGYKYDNLYGGSGFGIGPSGGNFQLQAWLNNLQSPLTRCNSYDQAALVQVIVSFLFGLMNGAPSRAFTWCFLKPYGFINQANMLGWGQCNNPFFGNSRYSSQPIVAVNDSNRSAFDNHAFIIDPDQDKILDTTCGPHQDTESLTNYISNAIDSTTTLYNSQGWKPGVANQVGFYLGVWQLNQPLLAMDTDYPPNVKTAIDRAMDVAKVTSPPPVKSSNEPVLAVAHHVVQGIQHLNQLSQDKYIGPLGSRVEWTFGNEHSQPTSAVSMVVLADHDSAVQIMRDELATFQVPANEVFRAVPDADRGQYELVSTVEGREVIFVRGNVLVRVRHVDFEPSSEEPGADRDAALGGQIANVIAERLKHGEIDPPLWHSPDPEPLVGAPQGPLHVGDEFTIHASVSQASYHPVCRHTESQPQVSNVIESSATTRTGVSTRSSPDSPFHSMIEFDTFLGCFSC